MRRYLSALLLLVSAFTFGSPMDDGKAAFARQDWSAATASFTLFLAAQPDDVQAPTAAFLRAVSLYQAGNARASLDAFQKLERSWPQSEYQSRLAYWKGTAALAAGQAALAERELVGQTHNPQDEPFGSRALLNLGLARLSLGKPSAAIEAFQSFTALSKETALLAQAWALWGEQDALAGRLDEAIDHWNRAQSAQPGGAWDLGARTQVVDLLTAKGRFSEAKTALDQAVVAFPQETDRWSERRIPILKGLGDLSGLAKALEERWNRERNASKKQILASDRGNLAETSAQASAVAAIWWLRASTGPDESLGAAAILRYSFLIEGAEPLNAAKALEAWLGSNPNAPSDKRELIIERSAVNRVRGNDGPGARKAWDKLIGQFPSSAKRPSWLLSRGKVLLEGGDDSRALADFSRILKDYPRAEQAPEARYQTGLVYLKRAEPARAEAWFYGLVQDLKTGDLYQRALLARGVSFVNAGQIDLARSSLQRLIREEPRGPWAGSSWAALGRNALQARLFDEAVDAYSRAGELLSSRTDRAQVLWSGAEALAGAGRSEDASSAYLRYAREFGDQPRAAEAPYLSGAVFASAKDWQRAYEVWKLTSASVKGEALADVREGLATALVRLGRPEEGWDQIEVAESLRPSADAWYRWGQAATAMGQGDWASRAFTTLLQKFPESAAAEAALPRAAGALLTGGKPSEALARYAEYFKKLGRQPAAAPVAKAAVATALAYPDVLESMMAASRTWNLAPEVGTEFQLGWAQSRLDSDSTAAVSELQNLAQVAPWTTQRSEALAILGRWHLAHGRLVESRRSLEAAANLGDDVSVFRVRSALAQVSGQEGDWESSARQREVAEKTAGPGVPLEFKLQVLQDAVDAWNRAKKPDEAQRVLKKIASLKP